MRRWVPAVVLGCTLLSLLTGLVVGWFSVWFQIGARADREDYLVAVGGYGAGALVGLVGLASLWRLAVRGWPFIFVAGGVVLLALLALRSLGSAAAHEKVGIVVNNWWDGAGGVLACPWTWPPLVLGVLAAVGRGPRRALTGRAAPPAAP
jgi:hypothetical protein